ncbi:hypothetical protein EPN54_06580 [bacterium]|nr:MAG: hypothetical protein EPN54_06580 [bacterium]
MDKSRIIKSILILVILAVTLAVVNHPKQRRLNVILVVIDALRYDHLSCYGYKRETCPNIDALAKKGALFTQAISQSSHTAPSVSSIMTSVMPNAHFVSGWGCKLNPKFSTLSEILKSRGFKNAFFCGNKTFKIRGVPGMERGFDSFFVTSFNEKEITAKTIQFIRRNKNRQFFIYAHYMNTHSPYIPSEQFKDLFIDDNLYDEKRRLPIVKPSDGLYGYGGIPEYLSRQHMGITNPDYYIAKYDQGLRTVDEEIGTILKALEACRLDKKTIFIITSDHGEMLGEKNLYFHHAIFLYEPLIRVPLIIRCDKIIPRNKVIKQEVSASIDIMPTILDILGINNPGAIDGVSLLPLIRGKTSYPPPYVLADEGVIDKCIRTQEWKLDYIIREGRKEYGLYDLKNDPGESRGLPLAGKGESKLLKDKIDGYIQAKFKKGYASPLLSEDEKNSLRSLGYIQ